MWKAPAIEANGAADKYCWAEQLSLRCKSLLCIKIKTQEFLS